jgi:hypothetical protein
MRARRLLALLLAVATLGLADLALGHAHRAADGGAELVATDAGRLASATPGACPVCPGASTWRAGAAPAATPRAHAAPPSHEGRPAATAPASRGRLVAAAGGPRAPPASR